MSSNYPRLSVKEIHKVKKRTEGDIYKEKFEEASEKNRQDKDSRHDKFYDRYGKKKKRKTEEGEGGGGGALEQAMGANYKPDEEIPVPDLPVFDFERIPDDACVVYFGKRRTGKTWQARDLLWEKRNRFYHGLVITKTKFNGFWQNYFPTAVVHGNYDPVILQNFMMLQIRILLWNDEHKDRPDLQINPNAVVILDDIVADKSVRYCDTLATLFYNGRHFKIMVIVCSQYVYGLPPGLRSNADFAFIMTQAQKRQRDQLAEDYADKIYDKDFFMEMLDKNTQDRHALVVDLSDPYLPLDQQYFKYQAKEVPLFEIGALEWKKKVWTKHDAHKIAYTNK